MTADIAALLAEAPWLARLARSLTSDAAEADDLVQETYAAALRSPPESDRPVRPWLRRVVVNLARMRNRGRTRRSANERAVEVHAEPVRTPQQLVERAQLERRLAELVLELDEPFRTTVLLRYREGLSAEQIAKQQGIPAGTVRSRLKTALDRIRSELNGDERTRMHFLFGAPMLAANSGVPAAPIFWRFFMAKVTSKIALAVVALMLLLAGAIALRPSSSPQTRDAAVTQGAQANKPATAVAQFNTFAQPGVVARRVRGRVTSEGAPYAGAIVQIVHAETEAVLGQTQSGTDGAFDLGDRAADVYLLTASAPNRAALPVQVDLRVPTPPDLELRLAGCSHLRGSVVDGSGTPIPHARIARQGAPAPFVETDAQGRYDFCTHFGATTIQYAASGFQSMLVYLDIAANTTRDIVLIPEATVEGKVVTVDGSPVAGAWIVIDPNDVGPVRNARATGVSMSNGTFRIGGVSPGRNLINAFASGLQSPSKQEVIVGAGETADGIIVTLSASATVSGVVVSGGRPVAGVGVGMRIGNRDERGVLAVTQADGTFAIDRAPRGDIALYVENHTVIEPRSVRITEKPSSLRVEVARLGAVRGRVLRGDQPVTNAQVRCPNKPVFTDASGSYACDGVDPGPQEISADLASGEWGYATVTVRAGETAALDITLTFSAAICGRVVDEDGMPVSGVEVRVAEQTTNDFGRDTTANDGAFCAKLLTGGTYNVSIYAGPHELAPREPLAAVSLGPTETKRVTASVTAPRLSITGLVRDPDGAPVVDAVVRVVAANQGGAPWFNATAPKSLTITDDSGHFEVGRLAVGEYMLIAVARDGSAVITPAVAAGTHDVEITVALAGRIEGTLVGFASAPAVTAVGMTGMQMLVNVEVDGNKFRAGGLAPGPYVLMAVTDGHEADTQTVDVLPGKTARTSLTSRGVATIAGTLRDFRTRAAIPGARCDALARKGDAMGTIYLGPDSGVVTDAQGAFSMTATAGELQVVCMGAGVSGSRIAVAARDRATTLDVWGVASNQVPGQIDATFEAMHPRIRELTNGGSAHRAGLSVGDEVIAVDGASVIELGARETERLITERPAGKTAALTIMRGGAQRSIVVTVRGAN